MFQPLRHSLSAEKDPALPLEHPGNWLLMLDVDGTLLDIAPRPDAVSVPLALKDTLLRLHEMMGGALVLMSGRSVAELDALFSPLQLNAVGLHGGETRFAGKRLQRAGTVELKRQTDALLAECRALLDEFPRLLIEHKPLSVALHYRRCPEMAEALSATAQRICQDLGNNWQVLAGKMVFEIKPKAFTKAEQVRRLHGMKAFSARKPVYAGDDTTDEAALLAVRDMHGYAVKVGGAKLDEGVLYAEDPTQLRRWLLQLANFSNTQMASQPLRKLRKQKPVEQMGAQRVIIVSNRVSPLKGGKVNTGGLAVAMSGVLQNHGGIWVGWSGKIGDNRAPQEQTQGDVSHIVRDLSAAEHEGFYQQFCNGVLWPLMHENVGLSSFSSGPYETYLEVNRQFADLLVERLKPTDVIWVHDFHFIPLAAALRERGVTNRIGFFLHTPFASKDVLLTLPVHKQLMECLYAYDVVGFQTQRDLEAFRDYSTSENLRPAIDGDTMRETMFGHFPIGIQTERFHAMAERTQYDPKAKDLLASLAGRQLILGVDRLDYSKGIVPRMKAIDAMLANDQSLRKAFSFLQIAPPTREGVEQYAQLRAETEALVGHVNGKYADVDWVPIRFLVSGVRRELLAAFYRMARVCLVTPLRDGMNLVAKEFVAAQDPENPGVLVLSRFAGAAEELQQAMLVNPYDVEDMADSIRQALVMPLRERKERWQALYRTISNQTLENWYQDFLDALAG